MIGLGDKIRVEPLDPQRIDRLEQRLMAAYEGVVHQRSFGPSLSDRLSRLVRQSAPVLAVAAVLVVGYFALRATPERHASTTSAPAAARIVTDEAGETTYHVGNAEIAVAPNTTLEIRRHPVEKVASSVGEEVHVDLLAGAIECDVEPIAERPPFIVHAGEVDVTVVGTAFKVEHKDGQVRVHVTRGRVMVSDPSGSRFLNAGESWASDVRVAAAEGAGSGAGSRLDSGQVIGSPDDAPGADDATDGDTDVAGSLHGRRASAPVAIDADGDGRLHGRRASAPGGAASERKRASEDRRRGRKNGQNAKATRGADTESKERRALKQARPARGTPPTGDADLAGIMATELDDPRAAIARYQKIALGRGAAAEFALYSVAYLQAMKLGQRSDALATLRHYQRRFASGKNRHREPALWLRIRMLCVSSDRKDCRAAAHSYLKSFPDGEYADLAGRIIYWDM